MRVYETVTTDNFYPRPPGGGRPLRRQLEQPLRRFLSTPSGWRATPTGYTTTPRRCKFLSTPSGWRATLKCTQMDLRERISIHALRVEGDTRRGSSRMSRRISIHALRVEGDYAASAARPPICPHFYPRPPGGGRRRVWDCMAVHRAISIHALRVEGDPAMVYACAWPWHFYPRPPGGGRPSST